MPIYHDMGQMWRITLHTLMLHLTKKPCSLPNEETTRINICYSPSHCLPSTSLPPCNLAHTHYDVRQDVQGTHDENNGLFTLCPKQVYEYEYHTFIQCSGFDHIQVFHTSSTKPNPCTSFSHNHLYVHW